MELTKADYLSYKQCPKSFWIKKKKPKWMTNEETESTNEVKEYLQMLLPNGTKVEADSLKEKIKKTKELIFLGHTTIFGATFQYGNMVVTCDVLHQENGKWGIYKITASTSVKERQIDDISLQYYLAKQNASIHSAHIIHLNKDYIRKGELDVRQLFVYVDVTENVTQAEVNVGTEIEKMERLMNDSDCEMEIGSHCDKYGKESSPCAAKGHCWSRVPAYSVFNIPRIGKKAMELYKQGIVKIEDIPDDFKLSDAQRFQVDIYKNKRDIIDIPKIKEFLETFTFPLYFLDFETFQQTIPLYDGVKPYQQIPFQFSLHVLTTINEELIHKEFLAKEGTDPRRKIAERLVKDIPADVCVVAYNMSFEKMVLKELAEQFPDLSEHLMSIYENVVDLMIPFQKKWYYTNAMKGSYSIKYVLPALLPNDENLNYKNLNIQNGSMAMGIYAILHTFPVEEIEQIRQDLLAYCRLDTYAMVKIWEVLNSL